MKGLFDLNIEQVLEHWELEHAVREIIANALDEKFLTKTGNIEIFKQNEVWHIRDFGRGLNYGHFTQNENKEKLESPFLIGKFGVGLKDALAVFYRKGVKVSIESKYSHITLKMAKKSGFDVETLHAVFEDPIDYNFEGTDFLIYEISDEIMEKAKGMFLCFSGLKILEGTKYGEVYNRKEDKAIIYINGVQVAVEENFMFSYNITNINVQIKKALNRERSNVGRTAYSDVIKNILRQCSSENVLLPLVEDLENILRGSNRDESNWVDIATYAAKTLNKSGKVVFMTPIQRSSLTNQQVEVLEQSGKKLVMVTDNVFCKIDGNVVTYDQIYREYTNSYKYDFVSYSTLSLLEKQVFNFTDIVLKFLKKWNYKCDAKIKISETIKVDEFGLSVSGVWDSNENAIIIKRDMLRNKREFLGTLLHEFAHYHSGYDDNSREFENVLTEMLGYAMLELKKEKDTVIPKRSLWSKLFGLFK